MFYSKATNGFYSKEIHGKKMPPDVVEITDEVYKKLFEAQSSGKIITSDNKGHPVVAVLPAPTKEELLKKQIRDLEREQTPRRIRESFIDDTWIKDINKRIEALRVELEDLKKIK